MIIGIIGLVIGIFLMSRGPRPGAPPVPRDPRHPRY